MARPKKSVIEYRIYDLATDFPAMCLSGETWRISDVLSNRLHFHNCMEIGFCHTDGGFLIIEDERVPFTAGDVFLIPRHVPHTTCSRKGCRSQWSYLFVDLPILARSEESVRGGAALERVRKVAPGDAGENRRIHFLCGCLLEELRGERADRERMTRVYAQALLGELHRLEHHPKPERGRAAFALKPALEFIHSAYMEPCRVETLAEICHLSQTHFRRLFLSIMGSTPLQFLNFVRISRACALLDTTNEPILSIAQAVGLGSIPTFNRNFQQIMGVSPREYRRASALRSASPVRKDIESYRGWMYPEERPSFVHPDSLGMRDR